MFNLLKFAAFLVTIFLVAGLTFASQLRHQDRRLLGARPLGFACALIALAFLAPNVWVFSLCAGVLMLCLARDAAEAAALFIFGYASIPPLTAHILLGGKWFGDFSAANAFALTALLTVFKGSGRLRSRWVSIDACITILICLTLFSEDRSTNLTQAMRPVVTCVLDILLPYLVISRSLTSTLDVKRWMLVLGQVVFCLSCEAVFEVWRSWPLYIELSGHLHAQSSIMYRTMLNTRAGFMRAVSSFEQTNSFSVFMGFGWVILLCARSSFRTQGRYYAVMGVCLVGLLASNSRGGFVTAALGTCLLDAYRRRYASLFAKGMVAGAAVLLIFAAASSGSRLANFVGKSGNGVGTAEYRQQLFKRGMEEFPKAPLFGQDANKVTADLEDMKQGEGIIDFVNGWLYFLLTTGLVGIGFFALVFLIPAASMWRIRGAYIQRLGLSPIAACLFAISVTYALVSFTSGFGARPELVYTYLLALGAALDAVARQLPRSKPINQLQDARSGLVPTGPPTPDPLIPSRLPAASA